MRSEANAGFAQLIHLVPRHALDILESSGRCTDVRSGKKHACRESISLQDRECVGVEIRESVVKRNRHQSGRTIRLPFQPPYDAIKVYSAISMLVKKSHVLGEPGRRGRSPVVLRPGLGVHGNAVIHQYGNGHTN